MRRCSASVLRGAVAAGLLASRIHLGQARRIERAEAGIGGRDEEAAVGAHADVARRGMHIAAREQRRADAADLLAQGSLVMPTPQLIEGLGEEVRACRSCQTSAPGAAVSPAQTGERAAVHGTPGSICGPIAHLAHAQRLHHRARGFAAGHDQLPHAALDQTDARCATSACSTISPARGHAESRLHALTAVGSAVA